MLLKIAVSDAYGAGFEFAEKRIIEKEHDMKQYYGSRIDDLLPGQYTDDTQMTIAIMELMLSQKEWNEHNIAEAFLNTFKRDSRKGYAKGFYRFLLDTDNAIDFNKNIINNSIRNGAAMRSVPLGIYSNIEEVKERTRVQAKVTHDTFQGVISSQAVSLMSHYFIYNIGDKKGLKSFIEKELEYIFLDDKTDRTKCDGIDTVNAVLTVLKNNTTLSGIINESVLLGGDTDSVASIAVGVASFSSEFKDDLPPFLFEYLENEKYGKDFLEKLDKAFFSKYNKKT